MKDQNRKTLNRALRLEIERLTFVASINAEERQSCKDAIKFLRTLIKKGGK